MIKKILLIIFVSVLSSNILAMSSCFNIDSVLSQFTKEEQKEQLIKAINSKRFDRDTVAYLSRLLEILEKEVSEK